MTDTSLSELRELVHGLNHIARSVIEEDGEHEAMFFLRLVSGDLEVRAFADAERPVGEARAREMAEAAMATGASAVAFVSEAWSAAMETVPEGGGAGDAPDALDVLLVAAVDQVGNTLALETTLSRSTDGAVELGASEEQANYAVYTFDAVRDAWGLPRDPPPAPNS